MENIRVQSVSLLTKEPPKPKSKYELKNVVCDYGIFENDKMVLLLNDYMNAEFILEILKADERNKRFQNMVTLR